MIYSLDIEPDLVKMVSWSAEKKSLYDVVAEVRNFGADGSGRQGESVGYVPRFNIFPAENPISLSRKPIASLCLTEKSE
jgi:hypothetical protein